MSSPVPIRPQPQLRPPRLVNASRRWSLDNSVTDSEGYIKDIRRAQQGPLASIKDEEYPFMVTEQEKDRNKKKTATTSAAVNLRLNRQRRTASVDYDHKPLISAAATRIRPVSASAASKLSSSPLRVLNFSSSVDISVVPEDNECPPQPPSGIRKRNSVSAVSHHHPPPHHHHQQAAPTSSGPLETKVGSARSNFLRQRSSSLPRILPPIFDDLSTTCSEDNGSLHLNEDSAEDNQQQQDRQSNVVVREMQKFVCRQATDVTNLLPLPIPTNSRQGKTLKFMVRSSSPATLPENADLRRIRLLSLASTVAKVHGILFAVKQSSPALYFEFISTLNLDVDRSEKVVADKLCKFQLKDDEEKERISKQISSLTSSTSALPFSIITHGDVNLKSAVFKPNQAEVISTAKLPGLIKSTLGSPLLDLYDVILDFHSIAEVDVIDEGHLKDFLAQYRSDFNQVCLDLRVSSAFNDRTQLTEDFTNYFKAGIIRSALKANLGNNDACLLLLKNHQKICATMLN